MFGLGTTELIILCVILLALFIPAMLGAIWAGQRGRSAFGWFLIGAIFAPAVLVVLFLKPCKEVPGKFKTCQACMEFVKWEATVCRYCQGALGTG